MMNHPNYNITNPKLLYIDRYGHIYTDCKTYVTKAIGHIGDAYIYEKIITESFDEDEPPIFNMITVELSSQCHAKCFYCFQEDDNRGEKYPYYKVLLPLLKRLKTYWLFFSGGEILDQEDAMAFIYKYREYDSDTWLHLKTSGNVSINKVKFVNECFDSVMVSFNGFSKYSCETLMQVNLEKTIQFCEKVHETDKVNLCVKFLNSPICISELPRFIEWAIDMRAKAIAVQTVYHYMLNSENKIIRGEDVFESSKGFYWDNIYQRTTSSLERILSRAEGIVNRERCNLASDKRLFDILDLSNQSKELFRTDGVYIIE